ncbi:MAG TPA: hypothetical protein VMX18_01715 [Candidatus Bipolaricaulota bacterium]|nr:hypothetical protein [Candidatus Bipolaricaulota bacterium]
MRNKNKKQLNDDESLVNEILEKIRTGKAGEKEETVEMEKGESRLFSQSAARLKCLRMEKERGEKEKALGKIKEMDVYAQDFLKNMTPEEEAALNEMMDAIGAETEKERINNLAECIRGIKKHVLSRLVVQLGHFPYLEKYFALAQSLTKDKRPSNPFFVKKLLPGYFKLLPASCQIKNRHRPSGDERTAPLIDKAARPEKRKKILEKKIAKDFYIDLSKPSAEEREAIKNLLEISEEFKKLYEEYQTIIKKSA